jgi:hypothetical protein
MNDLEIIQNKIYEIRGQRVMLDRDLAILYGVETKVLNQSVKRNIERFPPDFMFQLTKEEFLNWKSQFVISNQPFAQTGNNLMSQFVTSSWGGTRKLPYAFTEFGVAMLSSVLRSSLAIQVNIGIMRAFAQFRHIANNIQLPDNNVELWAEIKALRNEMNDILADQNDINEDTRAQLDAISMALAELQAKEPAKKERKPIGFIQPKND